MFEARNGETTFFLILRWTARMMSTVTLILVLLFMFGEAPDPRALDWKELIGLGLFPTAFVSGLILGWRREFQGGLLATLSVAGFYLIYGFFLSGSIKQAWWVLIFVIPGILLLIHGSRAGREHGLKPQIIRGNPSV